MSTTVTNGRGAGASTVWTRAAWAQLPSEWPRPEPAPEEEPWVADQPGIAFDAALLATTLGLVAPLLPLREGAALGRSLARRPGRVVGPLGRLAGEAARIALGRSRVEPGRVDRRYADPAWSANPLFRALALGHLAVAAALEELVACAELDPADDYRLRLVAVNLAAALAPANSPLLNPAAIKAAIDTGGASAVTGARRFLRDVQTPPHLPARSEPSSFRLGEDLAATPGAVVLRTPLMELIQFRTTTAEVREEPLLFVPSLVNKYYLTDLSPGRSLAEHVVAHGVQGFHISWVNPTPEHRDLGLDAYVEAIVEAIEAVLAITGAERVHTLGVCAGGQVLSVALAHLAATGREGLVASVTMTVSVLDHSEPASPTGLISRSTAERALERVERAGVVDGRRVATSLAWLRPVDSIWWAWVQRYLLATHTPRVDLFHWSEDTANLPARMVRDMLELTLDNKLVEPGSLEVLDEPVDLRRVRVPAYLIAGLTDNLTPWRSCYRTASMLGSRCRFVLVTGGHLQAILRPPGGRSAGFRTASGTPRDPEQWLARSTERHSSWWDHWLAWLGRNSSGWRRAPRSLGGPGHRVLEPAPGSYVRRRLDGAPA